MRENTKETILDAFERRLQNTPMQERMAALVEIAKIANLRLLDLVEDRPETAEEPPGPPVLGEPPPSHEVIGGAEQPGSDRHPAGA